MVRGVQIRGIALLFLASCGTPAHAQDGQDCFPDAPSAAVATSTEKFQTIEAAGAMQTSLGDLEKPAPKDPADFLSKQIYTALANRNPGYHPLGSGNLFGRATYAASRTFVARDPSGRNIVNTSYFLRVLTSAFVHTAYRPYWNRPASAPFSDFGSTLGNDAGMNVLHEFAPRLQQLMKSHTPQFVSRIAERFGAK